MRVVFNDHYANDTDNDGLSDRVEGQMQRNPSALPGSG